MKEYESELAVVNDLLSQPFWRRGKRSAWYDRRAIIQGHLTRAAESKEAKHDLQWQTLEGVKKALMDEDTSLGKLSLEYGKLQCTDLYETVDRPGLVKRLLALEIKLGVPVEERSRSDGKLQAAPETTLHAVRLPPPHYDALGKENSEKGLHAYISVTTNPSGNGNAEVRFFTI